MTPEAAAAAAPWTSDPRWLAIIVSLALGAASIALQLYNRSSDRRLSEADASFDDEVAGPLRTALNGLGPLKARIRAAAVDEVQERTSMLDTIFKDNALEAFDLLSTASGVADHACGGTTFSDLQAELEDAVYTGIDSMRSAADLASVQATAATAATFIVDTVGNFNNAIITARRLYRLRHQDRAKSRLFLRKITT